MSRVAVALRQVVLPPLKRLAALSLKVAIEVPVAYWLASLISWVLNKALVPPEAIQNIVGVSNTIESLLFVLILYRGFCWSVPEKYYKSENATEDDGSGGTEE
ncbi:hypothetical protein [Halobellus limi]|uniref:hypothetical protein n=1 Tax=Halobellus limi TaxID=699433 RepID=UPI0010A403E3|nr:hypothetical protein [Halobellus limi]